MIKESIKYVEQDPSGAYRISGTRIGLESLVYAYLDGQSPETIHANYPSLSLEVIHGAIATYLHHREEIDGYLSKLSARFAELKQESDDVNAPLLDRVRAARRNTSNN